MTQLEMLYNFSKNVTTKLDVLLTEGQEVILFDMTVEDWNEDERFYELPTQFLYGKYNYADLYRLHRVYKEDGKIYVEGFDIETDGKYNFTLDQIAVDSLCEILDISTHILNS